MGGQRAGEARLVVNFSGDGVDGVDLDGHGQFVQVAVVENAAARSYLKGALLLLSARSMNSGWRTIWSQNRRLTMATAQRTKKRLISQKRARLRGTARAGLLRFRLAR
jgi:hypothetical protein